MSVESQLLAADQHLGEIVGGGNARLTVQKALGILMQGMPDMFISGVVICNKDGQRTIVDMAAVSRFSKEQFWKLMHSQVPWNKI